MNRLIGWVRTGLIDLKGDLRRFGLLIICLALGTSVIAAVGSVGDALKLAVDRDATSLMGGDLQISRPDRDATDAELAYFKSLGQVAHYVDTNARARAGDESALLDIFAVDGNYPLLGEVGSPQLGEGDKPAVLLGEKDGVFGAIVDPVLLDRLAVPLGQNFFIGRTEFQVRGLLGSLPDGALRGFHLGMTVLISTDAIAQMTDLRPPLPGLLTHHGYKLKLDAMTFDEAGPLVRQHLDDADWSVQSPRDAAGPLVRYYDLFTRYLLVIGLSSLLVGGVGVSNGVSTYIGERQRTIATLRTLGATGARILVHYLSQIGILIAIGTLTGVVLGAAASLIMLPLIGKALSVSLPPMILPVPLLIAAAFGILTGFAYAYLPLVRALSVSPALLFRAPGMSAPATTWRQMVRPSVVVPVVLAAAAVFALAAYNTGDVKLVGWYTLGVIVTFALLRTAGWLLQAALRRLPPAPGAGTRKVLRSIYGPGSSAPVIIVSIGLGLSMVLIMALLESNLHNLLLGSVTRDAPTFVATDMFDDEVATLDQMAADDPNIESFEYHPMLRGAITAINGQDPKTLKNVSEEASFLFSGEIPITWEKDLPPGSTVTDGEWWPADYSGPPLISLRSSIQHDLGLKIGDRVEIRMFGEKIETTIANFRDYHWQNGINFLITFSPGQIEAYPANFLGGIKAVPGHEKDVERSLSRAFPDIAFIPVGEALRQAADLLGQLGTAVNVVGGLAVANGLLVLAGTMAAGRKQRESDAVIEKVLGATRGGILKTFVAEHAVLGAFSALVASVVGIAGAWVLTVKALEAQFAVNPGLLLLVVVSAIFLTIAAGAITTWRALSTPPAEFLRSL